MTLLAPCIACRYGRHDEHDGELRGAIPGLIGAGRRCPCKGECRDRKPYWLAEVEAIKRAFGEDHIERGEN